MRGGVPMASKPEVRVERLVVDTNALIKRIRVDNLAVEPLV